MSPGGSDDYVLKAPDYAMPPIPDVSGWLTPDGTLHACEAWGHEDLANELIGNGELAAETLNWIKLSRGQWLYILGARITRAQTKAIESWCLDNGLDVPGWLYGDTGEGNR